MRKNNGFTLLEVIISVAALSVIGVFILQMYLTASHINERARNTDAALSIAVSELERSKIINFFIGTREIYFDSKWNPLANHSEQASFMLTVNTYPVIGGTYIVDGVYYEDTQPENLGLYVIAVEVTDIRSAEDNRVLTSLATKKYLGGAA